MQSSFTILGSCVTRDIFRLNDNLKLNDYFARTTLQSIFGEKYCIDINEIIIQSSFQKMVIHKDLTSAFLGKEFKENEFLIIDFIDERFKIIKQYNKVIGTASVEYFSSNLKDIILNISYEENLFNEWKLAFNKFVDHLEKNNMINKLILHECYYMTHFINKEDTIIEFTDRLEEINKNNKFLSNIYSYIKYKLPCIKTIRYKDVCYGYENHLWGKSPIHYIDRYYEYMGDLLKNV